MNLFTEIIDIITFLVINGLTKEYHAQQLCLNAKLKNHIFPWSQLITLLSLTCCGVKSGERWECKRGLSSYRVNYHFNFCGSLKFPASSGFSCGGCDLCNDPVKVFTSLTVPVPYVRSKNDLCRILSNLHYVAAFEA